MVIHNFRTVDETGDETGCLLLVMVEKGR